MTTNTCHTCHTAIPAGHAVLRSTDPFAPKPTAWHRACWELGQAVDAALIPSQRVASEAAARVSA